MQSLILIGGGGHAKSCIDVIEANENYRIEGIVDRKELLHSKISGYEIIGSDDDLPQMVKQYKNVLITLGFIHSPGRRVELFRQLKSWGAVFPVISSPLARVSRWATVGEGTIVMHHAVVNSHAAVGSNCILNTKCLIEHDCSVGDNCHISTGAMVNGTCKIGERCFIGSGSVIANNIDIADDCFVGAGSLVVKNLETFGVYVGSPARRMKDHA